MAEQQLTDERVEELRQEAGEAIGFGLKYDKIHADEKESLCRELLRLRAERDAGYPTAHAYEQVCKALEKAKAERDKLAAGLQRAREALESIRDCPVTNCAQCVNIAQAAIKDSERV